jgi:hypothetical protein
LRPARTPAAALMKVAPELLAARPQIQPESLHASKVPRAG